MNQLLQQLGIDRLSPDERLELISQIWESLTEPGVEIPIPDWHWREVERRLAEADANPGSGTPWEVVKARLSKRP